MSRVFSEKIELKRQKVFNNKTIKQMKYKKQLTSLKFEGIENKKS